MGDRLAVNTTQNLEQKIMISHALKDINYHDDIAVGYDNTVVEPRIVTNNTIYSKLTRFIPRGKQMLDLGCGTGHLTGRLGACLRTTWRAEL